MGVAVLSPCLLYIKSDATSEDKYKHYWQLEEFFERLAEHTSLKFQFYENAPYMGYKMKIPEYREATLNNYVMTNIYSKIIKMSDKNCVDLSHFKAAKQPKNFLLPDDEISTAFLSYINYLSDKDAILFIGEKNFNVPRPIEFIGQNKFTINTSTFIIIEKTNILLEYLKDEVDYDDIFPQKLFCAHYNDYVKNKIKKAAMDQSEKIALFLDIGNTVALYNYYEKDNNLIKINNSDTKKRIIYKKTKGRLFYLSIDIESGGFEVFDSNYKHLGQYDFSGKKVKKAEPRSHKLKH